MRLKPFVQKVQKEAKSAAVWLAVKPCANNGAHFSFRERSALIPAVDQARSHQGARASASSHPQAQPAFSERDIFGPPKNQPAIAQSPLPADAISQKGCNLSGLRGGRGGEGREKR